MGLARFVLLVAIGCGNAGAPPDPQPAPPPTPATAPAPEAPVTRGPIPDGSRQLVLAVSDTWEATSAELRLYQRSPGGPWSPVDAWPATLGKTGMAWGRGLHGDGPPGERAGPRKEEGDGKSPAGAFAVGAAFGYAERADTRLPYTPVDDSWRCVDDPDSRHYNQVLDATGAGKDWSSDEAMRRADDLYRWVVVIEHNPEAAPRGGSCIFFHVWSGPAGPTVGCTAMARDRIEALLAWLDPEAAPVLVALPAAEHRALAAAWGLPAW